MHCVSLLMNEHEKELLVHIINDTFSISGAAPLLTTHVTNTYTNSGLSDGISQPPVHLKLCVCAYARVYAFGCIREKMRENTVYYSYSLLHQLSVRQTPWAPSLSPWQGIRGTILTRRPQNHSLCPTLRLKGINTVSAWKSQTLLLTHKISQIHNGPSRESSSSSLLLN